MTVDDLKAQIRRELTVNKLINKEITSHITITDADVTNFYNANKASFNLAEPQVHMAQILVTPVPDRQRPQSEEQQGAERQRGPDQDQGHRRPPAARRGFRHAGAELLRGSRIRRPTAATWASCPQSNLEKASPELRKLVDSLQPGGVLTADPHARTATAS